VAAGSAAVTAAELFAQTSPLRNLFPTAPNAADRQPPPDLAFEQVGRGFLFLGIQKPTFASRKSIGRARPAFLVALISL
jgi:hypothetical protein